MLILVEYKSVGEVKGGVTVQALLIGTKDEKYIPLLENAEFDVATLATTDAQTLYHLGIPMGSAQRIINAARAITGNLPHTTIIL